MVVPLPSAPPKVKFFIYGAVLQKIETKHFHMVNYNN